MKAALALGIVAAAITCAPVWAASCGTEADDQKSLAVQGTIDFVEDDEADGKAFTYVFLEECVELEISMDRTNQCKRGDRFSAIGKFWWCDDDGYFADDVECLFENALEVTTFSCSR